MRKFWWKILGVALLIYTVIIGMTTPLKTGINKITLETSVGENTLLVNSGNTHTFVVEGYNSNYTKSDNRAWFKLNDIDAKNIDFSGAIEAKKIEVVSDNYLKATFDFPSQVPVNESLVALTLVVQNDIDGYSILPSAITLKTDTHLGPSKNNWNIDYLAEISGNNKFAFPYRSLLYETIRNTFFHVSLWFAMFILLIISLFYSSRYLMKGHLMDDIYASSMVNVAILFGTLGMITGSLWAKSAWGVYWTTDVKLNMATIAMLIYVASLILRSSIDDVDRRAKLSASYNIFAFVALIPLVFVIPRLTDSLHPGNGGNPALGGEDMDNTLRMVFYPAIIGFTLLGLWMSSLLIRYEQLKDKWLTR